jgi:hypothetical protein
MVAGGNFGSAAAMSLPILAFFISDAFGVKEPWRYAVALTSFLVLFGIVMSQIHVKDRPI